MMPSEPGPARQRDQGGSGVGPGHTARAWAILAGALLVCYLAVIVMTFQDYGITYDEDWRTGYGEAIVDWYASGFQDRGALTYGFLKDQGGFFNVMAQLAMRALPLDPYAASHLVNALFGAIGLVGVFAIGHLLSGPAAGLLAATLLALTPRFYGHSFNNPVDIPFAALYTLALYALLVVWRAMPHVPLRATLALGATIGLALAVRVAGVLLIAYVAASLGLWLIARWRGRRAPEADQPWWRPWATVVVTFATVSATAYAVMLVWWPAAQVEPLLRPIKAVRFATANLRWINTFDVFFEGRMVSTTDLPWYYVPKWFLITLPEFYLVAVLAGGGLWWAHALARRRRGWRRAEGGRVGEAVLLLVASAAPVGAAAAMNPLEYDEVRHYLFVVPPLAVIAAVCVDRGLRDGARAARGAVMSALAVAAVVTLVDMVALHPHQYVYFNRAFGGGVAHAARSYETDYWGNSYKEAVEWLVRQHPRDNQRPKVASCGHSTSTSHFLPAELFEYIGSVHDGRRLQGRPEIFLATRRWACDERFPGTVIHTVERQGATLLQVIAVRAEPTRPDDEQP